jgi:hypothetical protein
MPKRNEHNPGGTAAAVRAGGRAGVLAGLLAAARAPGGAGQ